jgi:hypothetical protein
MDPLPLPQQVVTPLDRLGDQTAQVGPLNADARHDLGHASRTKQVDFRLSCSSDVDMRGFMVERVNHKPEAVSTMNDDHDIL